MKYLQKTFCIVLAVLLYTGVSFAAFNDYVVSALDEVNIQLEKVATVQDDYSTMAQEYMQGKMGEMGDLQASVKQAKKVKQAQSSLEKMKKMQEKLQKGVENAKKLKDDAMARVQDLQKLKDDAREAAKEFKDVYDEQIKAAQDLAQQSYEKATAQFESISAQAQEMQNKINEQRAIDGDLGDEDDSFDEPEYEAESNRAVFNQISVGGITPLPVAMEALQYNLPQGIGEDGSLLPETISAPAQPMTMLPEASALQETAGMIENAALNAMLPDNEMLQQLPAAAQLLEAPSDEVLQQSLEAAATEEAEKEEDEPDVKEKTELSLEDQLLAADESPEPAMSSEEFKAYLAAKDAEKKAALPQRDIQAEKEQFQQKLQALDEAKRASLGLKSSRRSFGSAKLEQKSKGGTNE